jgi:hypothetical protein
MGSGLRPFGGAWNHPKWVRQGNATGYPIWNRTSVPSSGLLTVAWLLRMEKKDHQRPLVRIDRYCIGSVLILVRFSAPAPGQDGHNIDT